MPMTTKSGIETPGCFHAVKAPSSSDRGMPVKKYPETTASAGKSGGSTVEGPVTKQMFKRGK